MQGAGRTAPFSGRAGAAMMRVLEAARWGKRLPWTGRRPMIAWALSPVGMGLIAKALRLLTIALALALAAPSWAQTSAPATSVDETERGIVRVVVILESPQGRMLYGAGSGFVVAPNLVVTNAHVVAVARQHPEYQIGIVPPAGDGMATARIVSFSPMNELALLEYRGGPSLPPITISTVDPHTGDTVVALGYPDVDYLGASGADLLRPTAPSRTSGEIASLRDQAPTGDQVPTINHQAVISSGSSGGPLLDECGRVIGVNSWHVSGADTRETRGVATRAPQLLQFLDEAGVTPTLSDERCLSFTERAEADRTATIPINSATFLMTNMMPQAPDNNQGPWANFETYCRTLLAQGNELYIYAGGTGTGGSGSNGGTTTTIAAGHVTVPAFTWKIVVVLPVGNNDASRVTKTTRTIGIIMPNVQGIRSNPWQQYRVSIRSIEALTGYDFLSNVPKPIQRLIEWRVDQQ